jgi:hypothetical protein
MALKESTTCFPTSDISFPKAKEVFSETTADGTTCKRSQQQHCLKTYYFYRFATHFMSSVISSSKSCSGSSAVATNPAT